MVERKTLRVLIIEDSEDDALLLLNELERSEYEIVHERVQTEEGMRDALARAPWDVILSDYSMPTFSAPEALVVIKELRIDIPFLIVSGTIGEETAVEALKSGAHDFLVKGRLARLLPAIERELREGEVRRRKHEAEEALSASEERFRTLVSSMDDVVFTLDHDQRHDGVFGRWVEREGFTPEHFLGKRTGEIIDGAEVHEEANARALLGERTMYEWTIQGPSGPRFFQTCLSPRYGKAGEVVGLVGVGREITEQKRVQAQLVESDRMASVGMLAAGIAHEINNPLAAILANLGVAGRYLDELALSAGASPAGRELREVVDDVRESAERIRDIVRDLKVFSRSEDERRGPVNVQQVLDSSLRMARNEIRHRAKLVKQFAPVPLVEANEARLGQVFLNLIVNAAQAIPEGQSERNEIRVIARVAPDGRVVVEVSDTGAGIPPEVLSRLFVPFFTTKPAGVGTGLGLSICQRIVSSLGGEIQVESEPAKGSVFRVFLLPSKGEVPEEAAAPRVPGPAARRGRVLVIDDDPAVAVAIRRCLERQHEVVAVTRADEALRRLLDGARYDVIFCDLMMPQMSGMAFFVELARVLPDQRDRVVFVSGGAFTPEAAQFLQRTENQKLSKPFDLSTIVALVNERVR